MEEVNKTYSRRKNCGQVTPGMEKRNNERREEEELTDRKRERDIDYIKHGQCERKRKQENEVEGGVIHDVCP
jgi:hypothetical protein